MDRPGAEKKETENRESFSSSQLLAGFVRYWDLGYRQLATLGLIVSKNK